MKYLVTGGAGFIGSHIVDALVSEGHEVVVLDNLSSGHKKNLSNSWDQISFVEGDIRNAVTCCHAAKGCDGVYHEAALVSVPESINRTRDNHDINITGLLNVLEAARVNRVKRVVFASSAAVYGDTPVLQKREDMLPEPKSPYALSKIAGEYYLKVYAECYGLETVALRYFNVYGPRQDPSSTYSGVISIFSERIANGLPVSIYGDGQQTRDFVHVADVVQANLRAMTIPGVELKHSWFQAGDCAVSFDVVNVATGVQRSLLDLIAALGDLCGLEPKLEFFPSRKGDVQHSLADISLARERLKYNPDVPFLSGLQTLIKTRIPEE